MRRFSEEVSWRKIYPLLKELEGKDISSFWGWYRGGDFPVSYTIRKVRYNKIIVRCKQGGRVWDLALKPSKFLERIDWDIARFELNF